MPPILTVVTERVSLRGVQIGGSLNLDGTFRPPKPTVALTTDGIKVDGSVTVRKGFDATGEVRLTNGRVSGQVVVQGGTFHPRVGTTALTVDGLEVEGSLTIEPDFRANGVVSMVGLHVGGQLTLAGAYVNEFGLAVDAERLQVDREFRWSPERVDGRVSLIAAHVGAWRIEDAALAHPLILHGFRYGDVRPGPTKATAQRLVELIGKSEPYSAQPYACLAEVLRASGNDGEARRVLVASSKARHAWSGRRGLANWVWGRVMLHTVGYGYLPVCALAWLVGCEVAGTVMVATLYPQHFEKTAGAPPFHAYLYSLDQLLPLVDLGNTRWIATGAAQYVTWALVRACPDRGLAAQGAITVLTAPPARRRLPVAPSRSGDRHP